MIAALLSTGFFIAAVRVAWREANKPVEGAKVAGAAFIVLAMGIITASAWGNYLS